MRSTLAHLRLSLQRNLEATGNTRGKRVLAAARAAVRAARPSVDRDPVIEILTERFDTSVCAYRMSKVSGWIARSVDPVRVVERRRENFLALHAALRDKTHPVFAQLPAGVCPLFYAIRVADNRAVMTALRARGVEGWAWWYPMPVKLQGRGFAQSQSLREQVVVIPCHEGLTPAQVERVSKIVLDVIGRQP
jgi:perosamine synthetase